MIKTTVAPYHEPNVDTKVTYINLPVLYIAITKVVDPDLVF